MTILTKPFSEKKDALGAPLVDNEQIPSAPTAPGDIESQHHHRIIIFPARAHRVSTTYLCLLITALTVVSIGIIGGKILYNEYLSVSNRQNTFDPARFEGYARIPIDDEEGIEPWGKNFFEEKVDIDKVNKFERIYVPDFRNGRNGRFVHDFNTNITGIIDATGRRCFVMPLNHSRVLPPKSFYDLVVKLMDNYYKVDTEVVRETMRVVTPPISDTKSIGAYIANECEGMPIYKLEKVDKTVTKRSADSHPDQAAIFSLFSGKGITQFDIMNIDDLIAYEKDQINSP